MPLPSNPSRHNGFPPMQRRLDDIPSKEQIDSLEFLPDPAPTSAPFVTSSQVVKPDDDGPVLPSTNVSEGVQLVTATSNDYGIDDMLNKLLDVKGSDLHLSQGLPPMVRIHGDMQQLSGFPRLSGEKITELARSIMSDPQENQLNATWELDFAYELRGRSRFRVNVMRQKHTHAMVMRAIPWEIKNIQQLGLPDILNDFASLPRGLVLVTGPTGSGKSTTLAAIIDKANSTRRGHIITVEDPIEFVHPHKLCVVNQREVGEDTKSYAAALKHVLRQDPDIILVGEMRDLETISVALTAAETGHLVFATLHTQSAKDTVSRIIDVFPDSGQAQIRAQLANTIQGIVCQTLVKTQDGKGRVAGVEILIGNSAVKNLIREGKEFQIPTALQTNRAAGMQTMDSHLIHLVKSGQVKFEDAAEKVTSLEQFLSDLGGKEGIARIERQRRGLNNGGLQG